MADKDAVVGKIQELQGKIETAVSELPQDAWSRGVYEDGWKARQLLRHMASMSGAAGFALRLASAPAGGGPAGGGGFDVDGFNRQQVTARQDKSPAELLAEIKASFERDIGAVRAAPDDLIKKQFRAPWGAEGEVGDVIIESLTGHLGTHLADLRSAAQ